MKLRNAFSLVEMERASRGVARKGQTMSLTRRAELSMSDVGCEARRQRTQCCRSSRNTHRSLCTAFSLVEMLMALLVASLLMVALAPVITKKFSENLSISSIGGTRADYKRTWYYDPAKEYHEWSVPNGVNVIKVTAIGGGGAGGGSTYGFREFTKTEDWAVPAGVNKIRVFMTGGGGSGASGGAGTGTHITDIGGLASDVASSDTITTSKTWPFPSTLKGNIPPLPQVCKDSGVTQWTYIPKTSEKLTPGASFLRIEACGGGGGGGGWASTGSGGGSGGYFKDNFSIGSSTTSFTIRIGGYGGYGPTDDAAGGAGGDWGGGAGGGSAHDASTIAKSPSQDMGKGYGSGGYSPNNSSGTGGKGGAGDTADGSGGGGNGQDHTASTKNGGTGQGGAGKGGSAVTGLQSGSGGGGSSVAGGGGGGGDGDGGGGGGGPTWIRELGYNVVAPGGGGGAGGSSRGAGGGGGGGKGGGNGGNGGNASTIMRTPGDGGQGGNSGQNNKGGESPIGNSNFCAGGDAGSPGKPGYMKISWGEKDAIKCTYNQPANAGGGGGAGQIWMGEIDIPSTVTTIKMTVGDGGAAPTSFGQNGNPGGATSVGSYVTVSGGSAGTYRSDDSLINFSAGAGGGYLNNATFANWSNIANLFTLGMGGNGTRGKLVSENADGGDGGSTIDREGHTINGGKGGSAHNAGAGPTSSISGGPIYGAGGGGGGGVTSDGSNPGLGAAGAKGYIYIEWGEKNGGGGASGQVITQESVWVTPGTIVKIYAGKGGTAKALTAQTYTDSGVTKTQGYKGEDGEDGGDTYLIVKDASAEKKVGIAKGGKGGLAGGKDHGRGGGIKTDASGNYDPNNIQPEIENTTPGETATDEHGGMGGTIDEVMCPLLTELKKVGLGGCGGNTTTAGSCQNSVLVSGEGVNAGGLGNGGGGGAVVEKVPFKGGNGSGGMVTIEWSN